MNKLINREKFIALIYEKLPNINKLHITSICTFFFEEFKDILLIKREFNILNFGKFKISTTPGSYRLLLQSKTEDDYFFVGPTYRFGFTLEPLVKQFINPHVDREKTFEKE